MSGRMRTGLKAGISLALMTVLLTQVDVRQVARTLAGAEMGWLGLGLAAALLAWVVNTWKWQGLLLALGARLAFRYLLALNFVGMFYSIVLPGQVSGEVMKGIRLARSEAGGVASGLSIAMDRLTGLVALGAIGLVGLLLAPRVPAGEAVLWVSLGAMLVGAVPVTVAGVGANRVLSRWGPPLRSGLGWRGKLYGATERLMEGLLVYSRSRRALGLALMQALVFQLLVTASNYCAALSVGVELPIAALAWIVAAVSLVHLLPVSLAGLGVREGAYAVLLQQYGVPLPLGLSLSLAVFGIIVVQALLGGVVELLGGGRPSAALRALREPQEPFQATAPNANAQQTSSDAKRQATPPQG